MINELIAAISVAINAEFGDEYTIYSESVEQGLKKPCFFIRCINPTYRLYFDKRYFAENPFCIQYSSRDENRANEECNTVLERLFSCLEYVEEEENLIQGTKMHAEIVDGILNFLVNYDFFTIRKTPQIEMNEISQTVTAKE